MERNYYQENKNNPILKDDLSLRTWLLSHDGGEIILFLQKAKQLYGRRISFNSLMDQILAPIPEEKLTIADVQKNSWWMTLIEAAFQKHESGNHVGFMDSLGSIFADEKLAATIIDLMLEYEAEEYMDILSLIVEKNWGKKNALPYQNRTLRELIWYKPGKYSWLDAILEKWSHVSKKMLITGISDIMLKVPLGKTMWLRFQEKDVPEVSLYDIIASLVKEEERESSKILFHTLESILELKKK